MLALFVWPAPMTLKQIYLTITGVIVAYVFTWTPEWSTWALLVAMAIYDVFAVLMPGGPLKVWPHAAIQLEPDLWHLLRLPAMCEECRLNSTALPWSAGTGADCRGAPGGHPGASLRSQAGEPCCSGLLAVRTLRKQHTSWAHSNWKPKDLSCR